MQYRVTEVGINEKLLTDEILLGFFLAVKIEEQPQIYFRSWRLAIHGLFEPATSRHSSPPIQDTFLVSLEARCELEVQVC